MSMGVLCNVGREVLAMWFGLYLSSLLTSVVDVHKSVIYQNLVHYNVFALFNIETYPQESNFSKLSQ